MKLISKILVVKTLVVLMAVAAMVAKLESVVLVVALTDVAVI
jgi:hypothetical protein